eukprot:2986131-Rhodomonas_salina.1
MALRHAFKLASSSRGSCALPTIANESTNRPRSEPVLPNLSLSRSFEEVGGQKSGDAAQFVVPGG